jgi:hypothetical protein
LNNATIRKATVLVSQTEVFAHAAQTAYISTIDISNAFFQIPSNTNTSVTKLFTVTPTENAIVSHGLTRDLKTPPFFKKF